jgi:hypothetical protein
MHLQIAILLEQEAGQRMRRRWLAAAVTLIAVAGASLAHIGARPDKSSLINN